MAWCMHFSYVTWTLQRLDSVLQNVPVENKSYATVADIVMLSQHAHKAQSCIVWSLCSGFAPVDLCKLPDQPFHAGAQRVIDAWSQPPGPVSRSCFTSRPLLQSFIYSKWHRCKVALQVLLMAVTCSMYMGASWWLIIVNRFLMIEDGFGFPFTLAGMGMVFTWAATSVLVQFESVVPRQQVSVGHARARHKHRPVVALHGSITELLREQYYDYIYGMNPQHTSVCVQELSRSTYLTRILPLGLCSAGTMGLGNMAYQYLDVAVLEMLKSCCPVFVFLVSVAMKLEKFSWSRALSTCKIPFYPALMFCCVCTVKAFSLTVELGSAGLIAGGIAFTTACGARHVSRVGLALHLGSQVVEALRLCLAQVLMCNMRLHQFEALRQMSSACVLSLGLAAWLFEWERFHDRHAWKQLLAHPHWYLAAGVLLQIYRFENLTREYNRLNTGSMADDAYCMLSGLVSSHFWSGQWQHMATCVNSN